MFFLNSKHDALCFFNFKIWCVVFLVRNLTRNEVFKMKSCFLRKLLQSKSCFLEKTLHSKPCFLDKSFFTKSCSLKLHVKRKICNFYGVNWIKTWFLVCKTFFKICFLKENFFQHLAFQKYIFFEIMLFENTFFFKTWRFVENLIRILTRSEHFVSKFDALQKFNSKSDNFWNFFSAIGFLSCFPGSDWMPKTSVGVDTNSI